MNAVDAIRSELLAFDRTRALVARRPEIVHGLAHLVALYAPGGQWWRLRQLRTTGRTIPVRRARRKALALAAAVRHVEDLVLDRDLAALLTHGGGGSDPRLAQLPAVLATLRAEAEQIAALEAERGPGRPADPWRARFCSGVARALEASGERVTVARTGLFAAVLACCFTAAGEEPPEDPFPLLRRAARALRV